MKVKSNHYTNMGVIASRKAYEAPRAEVFEVNVQNVLCQSPGNESMGEEDVSGSFTQN